MRIQRKRISVKQIEKVRSFMTSLPLADFTFIVYYQWIYWLIDPCDSFWEYVDREGEEKFTAITTSIGDDLITVANRCIEECLLHLGATLTSYTTGIQYASFKELDTAEGEDAPWNMELPEAVDLQERIKTMPRFQFVYDFMFLGYFFFNSFTLSPYLDGWEREYPVPPRGNDFLKYALTHIPKQLINPFEDEQAL